MSNMAGVLLEAETAYLSRAPELSPGCFGIFFSSWFSPLLGFFCDVLICVFTSCLDVR